jgi:hypothetical protein
MLPLNYPIFRCVTHNGDAKFANITFLDIYKNKKIRVSKSGKRPNYHTVSKSYADSSRDE